MPLHEELLVSVATDPELTRSSVQLLRKHASESGQRVADYRRGLVERLGDYMIGQSDSASWPGGPMRSFSVPARAATR